MPRRLVFLFLLFQWNCHKANDTVNVAPRLPKSYFFIEGGNSFNRAALNSLYGTTTPDFSLEALRAFSFGIGYTRQFKKFVAAVSLRRVTLGEQITMNSLSALSSLPPVFISSSKNNFLIGLSGGYHFQFKKLSIEPLVGVSVSLNPAMNSLSTGYVASNNDTIFMSNTMRLTSGTLLFATGGLTLAYPIRISGYDFSLGLSCSYAMGVLSGYSSSTTFKHLNNSYAFGVNNKGTHVIYALQLIFPLSESTATEETLN